MFTLLFETDFDSLMFTGGKEQNIYEHCNFVEWGAIEDGCKKLVSKKVLTQVLTI